VQLTHTPRSQKTNLNYLKIATVGSALNHNEISRAAG
jgi:hypothetical protein